MPRLIHRVPKYRKHASGQALVTLNGRDIYLGSHGTGTSRKEYKRLIAEWKTNNRTLPARSAGDDLSVAELIHAYWTHAQLHYAAPEGKSNGELWSIKLALRVVNRLYGDTDVRDFGAMALRSVQGAMVNDCEWSRRYINVQVGRIRRMFRWALGREMINADRLTMLECVEPLRAGKTKAREIDPITTVDDEFIEAVIPWLSRHIVGMVRFQQLTGCRPGELVAMRWTDINTKNPKLWEYRPPKHKTSHRGHDQIIYINADPQGIIEQFRTSNIAGHVFCPRTAEDERRAALSAKRRTPGNSGNRPGTNRTRKPRKQPGESYNVESYRRAITRACNLANSWAKGGLIVDSAERLIPRWHPHQIRHNTATKLRALHGLEAAQVILGHRTLSATQIYAEKNVAKAKEIMMGGK